MHGLDFKISSRREFVARAGRGNHTNSLFASKYLGDYWLTDLYMYTYTGKNGSSATTRLAAWGMASLMALIGAS